MIVFTLLLGACSTTKLAYNQLDWLIPEYVNRKVSLSSTQRDDLYQDVNALLQWHCTVELENYSRWLKTLSDDFLDRKITMARLETYHRAIEQFWLDILRQALPGTARLLSSMNDQQIKKLFRYLEKENRAFRKEFVDPPAAQIRQGYVQMFSKRLQRWIGALTKEQQALLGNWGDDIHLLGADNLQLRHDWQRRFHSALEKRHDPDIFLAQLEQLFFTPEQYWPPTYSGKYHHNQEITMKLLLSLSQSLSTRQRQRLADRASGFAEDFDELGCSEETNKAISGAYMAPTRTRPDYSIKWPS